MGLLYWTAQIGDVSISRVSHAGTTAPESKLRPAPKGMNTQAPDESASTPEKGSIQKFPRVDPGTQTLPHRLLLFLSSFVEI